MGTASRSDARVVGRRPQVRNPYCRAASVHVRVEACRKEDDMGTSADFVGHIDITPPLNAAEIVYLTAFSQSRRCRRPGGPYVVPGNPMAETLEDLDIDSYNTVAERQPALWCGWVPCWDGCCVAHDGNEGPFEPAPWLRYLIAHFLKPGAAASKRRDDQFRDFTFDHHLDGMVVGCRRADKELFAVVVADNRVREKILRPADERYVDRAPLAYELAIDRRAANRRRRPRRNGVTAAPTLRSV
jgi:hypothetical protein